jgi:Fungal chitosanase of glycosyl hydrolase group 75
MNRRAATALGSILLFAGGVAVGQTLGRSAGQNTAENIAQRAPELADTPATNCARSELLNFTVASHDGQDTQGVPIWQLPGSQAFFFLSGITIDADGAPNAYHPDNIGLDDLVNAGVPGHWDGVMTDGDGNPLIQGSDDPFPGYYVSCTSLSDRTKRSSDPSRYVDASKVPYIVLPRDVAAQGGARLGDFAAVVNLRNGKSSYAIFADVGTLGEGSIALANNLGIWSDARQGGRRGGILYLVFPGSGNRQPRTVDEIQSETDKLIQAWGGVTKLTSCSVNQDPATATGVTRTPGEGQSVRTTSN